MWFDPLNTCIMILRKYWNKHHCTYIYIIIHSSSSVNGTDVFLFLLQVILVFTWIDFSPARYGNYEFPFWANAIGWALSFSSVVLIPAVAIFKILREKGSFMEVRILRPCIFFLYWVITWEYVSIYIPGCYPPKGGYPRKDMQIHTVMHIYTYSSHLALKAPEEKRSTPVPKTSSLSAYRSVFLKLFQKQKNCSHVIPDYMNEYNILNLPNTTWFCNGIQARSCHLNLNHAISLAIPASEKAGATPTWVGSSTWSVHQTQWFIWC